MTSPHGGRCSTGAIADQRPACARAVGLCQLLSTLVLNLLLIAGCAEKETNSPTPAVEPITSRPSVALQVLVVNDSALAESVQRLRGEWTEHSGGTLTATSKPWGKLATAKAVDADVVLIPARHLGEWCERTWLRPMRDNVLAGSQYQADDMVPLVRQKLCRFDGREMALPLGVQIPLFGYHAAWLAKSGGSPPNSWSAYAEVVAGAEELPLTWPARDADDHWPALMLLARAAAYASHPLEESILFDPQTMAPRIASAPFLRALEEWQRESTQVAAHKDTGRAVHTAADARDGGIVWAELPGAEQVFSRSNEQWQTIDHDPQQVTFLADGWLVTVTTSTRNATSAFELAAWLASAEIGGQLASTSTTMLPCRRSQLAAIGRWSGLELGQADATRLGKALSVALSRPAVLVVPRIPAVDEYLVALSEGVDSALARAATPADALTQADRRWSEITDRLGRDAQRRAYLHHLGIAEP